MEELYKQLLEINNYMEVLAQEQFDMLSPQESLLKPELESWFITMGVVERIK